MSTDSQDGSIDNIVIEKNFTPLNITQRVQKYHGH